MKKYLISVLLLLFLPLMALAQDIYSENENVIFQQMEQTFRTTLAADGYITQEIHDAFWDKLKHNASEDEIRRLLQTFRINFVYAQEYQKEAWESAKISYKNNKAVKTQRLIALENELPIKFEESLPYPKDSATYSSAVNSYKESRELANKSTIILLEAAAAHKQATFSKGQMVNINEDLINTVLANLDSSFKRFQLLLNESWSDSTIGFNSKAINEATNNDVPDFVKDIGLKSKTDNSVPLGIPFKPFNNATSEIPVDPNMAVFGHAGGSKPPQGKGSSFIESFKTQFKHIKAPSTPEWTPMTNAEKFAKIRPEFHKYLLAAKNPLDFYYRLNDSYEQQEHDRILENGPLSAKIIGRALGTITDLTFWLYLWIGLRIFKSRSKTIARTYGVLPVSTRDQIQFP